MTRRRTAPIALLAAGGLAAALSIGAGDSAGAQAVAHTTTTRTTHAAAGRPPASGRVIVVLKDQQRTFDLHGPAHVSHGSTAEVRAQQARVAGAIRQAGGSVRSSYTLINALAATLTAKQAAGLATRADVAEIIPDARIRETPHVDPPTDPNLDSSAGVAPAANTCPSSGVQLEPEALEATHADSDVPGALTARSLGFDGAGVTVAWMAEGIDIDNPDFLRDGKSVFTDYQDFSGDGTAAATDGAEAFLDASAIGAQPHTTYDVSHFSKLPLSTACQIKVEGEAPGADMVGLKIFSEGFTTTSAFLDAIEYAVTKDHVDVLNQSFGGNPIPDTTEDVVRAADEAAVAAGTTITVSTGDAGITNTIGSPSDDPAVISVGASTTYRFDLQTGYAGARFPGITGWLDDNISSLSSAGFTQSGGTQNLVAPGELNFGLCSKDLKTYEGCADYAGNGSGLEASGGTSESAPIVAGIAALVIQAYESGHDGAAPTPGQVKQILVSTADDIKAPAQQQGAGLVDAYKAVQLAKSYGPDGVTTGSTLLTQHTQIAAVTTPGETRSFTDTVTNEGSTSRRVDFTARQLGYFHQVATNTVTLSDTGPKYTDFQGYADNYAKVTFNVPAGADRLAGIIAYQGVADALSARVRLTLVDPHGDLAAYSLPQGVGNYGRAEVADPVPGTWTGYITSRPSAKDAMGNQTGGTTGPVVFSAGVANFHSFGTVTPGKLVLAPGQSGTVTLKTKSPGTPGDTAGSLLMSTTDPADLGPSAIAGSPDQLADRSTSTIPVVLRTVIPAGPHSFVSTLTGPNGRDDYPGVKAFYQIAVPAGAPELNVKVGLSDRDNEVQAALVSPTGNVAAFASNVSLFDGDENGTREPSLQLHAVKPVVGYYTLVLDFTAVPGTKIASKYSVITSDTAVPVSSTLPTSPSTVIKAGATKKVFVKIRNDSSSVQSFFVDPRLTSTKAYGLASLTDARATAPPTDNVPQYLVPPGTTKLVAKATTTSGTPIEFDTSSPLGDPDIESNQGAAVSTTYTDPAVTPGEWGIVPAQVGPYAAPVTPVAVRTSMTARTLAFDPALSSPNAGDLWLLALDPTLDVKLITVGPGQTKVIPILIKAGAPGVHRGTLFVDDANLVANFQGDFTAPNGNQVAAVPYSYRVQ